MPRATVRIAIHQPPEDVYAFIADAAHAPRWSGLILDVRDIHPLEPGGEGRCTLTGRFLGHTFDVTYRCVTIEHPLTLLLESVNGLQPHTWRYAFTPDEHGTDLTIVVDGDLGDTFQRPAQEVMALLHHQLEVDANALKELLDPRARGSPEHPG